MSGSSSADGAGLGHSRDVFDTPLDVEAPAARDVLQRLVRPMCRQWLQTEIERPGSRAFLDELIEILLGSVVLVHQDASTGRVGVRRGTVCVFTSREEATSFDAQARGDNEEDADATMPRPGAGLVSMAFAEVVTRASGQGADTLIVDPCRTAKRRRHVLAFPLAPDALVLRAGLVDPPARLAVLAADPVLAERLLSDPERGWWSLEPEAVSALPEGVEHGVLPLFTSPDEAALVAPRLRVARRPLKDLVPATVHRGEERPPTRCVLGLGSPWRPLEATSGALAGTGTLNDVSPSFLGEYEEPLCRALAEFSAQRAEGARLLVRFERSRLSIAAAFIVEGVAHAVADLVPAGTEDVATAALRLSVSELVSAAASAWRDDGRTLPRLLRFGVDTSGSRGSLSFHGAPGSVAELLVDVVRDEGYSVHGCLPRGALLGPRASSARLRGAVERRDAEDCAQALMDAAPAWYAVGPEGGAVIARWPGSQQAVLVLFSSLRAASQFRGDLNLRPWTPVVTGHGLRAGVVLGVDPTASDRPLVLGAEVVLRLGLVRE